MRTFRVHQGRNLISPAGELVACGGESVDAKHPAVLALKEPEFFGMFEGDDDTAPAATPAATPAHEQIPDLDD